MLRGEMGEAARVAMTLLHEMGQIVGAHEFIDITSAHIDGCLYHGQAGLDFAEELIEGGATVAVPTTLNVSSLDLLHPQNYRGDPAAAAASRRQMDAYVAMGCQPTWTCSPYQLPARPKQGEQIAWGESNAIVFANSVMGARTERYGDFMDICCALTGRAPKVGLHTDEGRAATLVFDVEVDEELLSDDSFYPLLGGIIGVRAGMRVVAVCGLDDRANEDRLKALGAAAASTGSSALIHVIGVTPEAPDLESVTHRDVERVSVTRPDLVAMFQRFDRDHGPLGAVSVGTPHFSQSEFEELASLVAGRKSQVPFLVNTGRETLMELETSSALSTIRAFGARIVTDTCVYITPILGEIEGVLMTNSGKAAFYAPGNLGVGVAFGSLADCVESASAGELVRSGVWA